MIGRIAVLSFALTVAFTANASQLITNGGFESGDFTGWTVTTNDTSPAVGDWFVTDVSASPLNGFLTNGPASGDYYAVTDSFEPGSRALTQSFVDPIGATSVVLSFDIFVNDEFGDSGTGGQVDLLAGNANPLTGTPLTVLYGPSDTAVNGGVPNPWIDITMDITADLTPGDTYQLQFLESDATGPINMGVDDVSLDATPEPNTVLLLISAGALAIARRRYRVTP